jgi:hypothetical protein
MTDEDDESGDEDDGVCSHKGVCKKCRMVAEGNRPLGCQRLVCKDYVPCDKCGQNKYLKDGVCKDCSLTEPQQRKLTIKALMNPELVIPTLPRPAPAARDDEVSYPGDPPSWYSAGEKAYYERRWLEYKGYYRNPSASFTCHAIIQQEVKISGIERKIGETRGEYNKILETQKSLAIKVLSDLRDSLPDKEAEEVSDDEKSIAGMYDSYVKETKLRAFGKVSRIFSPEALALADQIPHRSKVLDLLINCGFKPVDIDEAMKKYRIPDDDATPEDVIKLMGFSLHEKYALSNIPGEVNDEEIKPETLDLSEVLDDDDEAVVDNNPNIDNNEEDNGPVGG